MKGKRYTEEQIILILKEHETGVPVAELVSANVYSVDERL